MFSQETERPERKDKRFNVDDGGRAGARIHVMLEGETVDLVNYSVGGMYFLSKQRYYAGDVIQVSMHIKNRNTLDLSGTVVQVRIEEGSWGIAIKFSERLDAAILT